MVRRGETRLGRLLPWFSAARMRDVAADLTMQLRCLAQGRVPDDDDGAPASAVHGLGLLTVTAMVVTGTADFFMDGPLLGHLMLGLHRQLLTLMWAYLIGHAGLAVLYHLLGSDIFARIFWVSPPRPHPFRTREPPTRPNPGQRG